MPGFPGPAALALAALSLVCTAGPAAAAAAPDSTLSRLSRDAMPTHEAVELTLDPERAEYTGHVTISLAVAKPITELRFHARALTIDSVSVRGPAGAVAVAGVDRLAPDQARVRLSGDAAPGAYTLAIQFHNQYNTKAVSLYKVATGGHAYLFTQFEDTEAREAFPCWDEPDFKFPWTVTLTVPAADLAVGNTPITRETKLGAMRRVEFARTKPLPSYLIAVAVGPFESVPITGLSVPGRVITVQGASGMAGEAAKYTPAILRSLEKYFGRPYPYEKLDLIAAPEFQYGAMENAGAIVFADRALLINPRAADPSQRRRVVSVIAHECAHQWFGDLVTMKWWDDLWLNESFATWMATKVMDDIAAENHSGTTSRFTIESAMKIDSRPSTRAMRAKVASLNLSETANELTYDKGESVLDMFEGWLGPDKFRAGVLEYLKQHEWSNAEGKDLWLSLGRVSGEDIDAAMASFLEQAGVPLVTVVPEVGGRVRLTQHRFLTAGAEADPTLWRIPVTLRYPAGGAIATKRVWLTGVETVVNLGAAPAWIEPNAGASGYYRWSVPDAMLDSLLAARSTLSVRERIDLVLNLTALLRAGSIHGDRYLGLMSRMADDPAAEVTAALVDVLNEGRAPLSTSHSQSAFDQYVRTTLAPGLTRFGMKPVVGEELVHTLYRPRLLRLLANTGDPAVLDYAESLGRSYRKDPASVPPSLVEFGVVVGARRGDRALFDDYRRRFETTTVPIERTIYLAGLGSFQNPTLVQAALDFALNGPLRPHETLTIPSAMATDGLAAESRGATQIPDEVTRWMEAHYTELAAKMPPNFATRTLGLESGCSQERIAELQAFIADPAHRMMGGEARARRLSDLIRECSTLHERESERVERWLLTRAAKP